MSERRRAGRLVVPTEQAPADKALLERDAIEELSHHADPWRVLRILSEFVEGFDALGEVGPAVTVFGSARSKPDDPYYKQGIELGGLALAGEDQSQDSIQRDRQLSQCVRLDVKARFGRRSDDHPHETIPFGEDHLRAVERG